MNAMPTTRVILALSTALVFSGCDEDFTLLSPISDRNVESFYRTPTDFTVAINGAYSTLASNGAYNRSYVLLHEMRSDNTMNGGGNTGLAEVFFRIAHFSELATASELSNPWTTAYQGIARTNTILDRLDNLDDGPFKERIRGEALFIRSLFYYQLAVLWGNVPLQLEPVTSPDIEVNQVSADVVYAQIASDLELEPEKVTELRRIAQDPLSLETPLGEEEDSTLGDFVPDHEAEAPVTAASFKLLQEYLSLVLEGLNERERQVLIMRFGLADGKVKTLEEVGSHFNVTRERIRQIETKALAKLRQPARAKRLEGYLEGV